MCGFWFCTLLSRMLLVWLHLESDGVIEVFTILFYKNRHYNFYSRRADTGIAAILNFCITSFLEQLHFLGENLNKSLSASFSRRRFPYAGIRCNLQRCRSDYERRKIVRINCASAISLNVWRLYSLHTSVLVLFLDVWLCRGTPV